MTATPTTPRAHVNPTTLRDRLAGSTAPLVIDVRTPAEYAASHIPGSYNVPLDLLGEHRAELAAALPGEVVLVCRSGERARRAEAALTQLDTPGLSVLDGGLEGWIATGGTTSGAPGGTTWAMERQVRGVAGSLVLSSLLLGLVLPKARWLAAGIGAGLTYSALSDTCGMAFLLAKLPYNRQDEPDVADVLTALREA